MLKNMTDKELLTALASEETTYICDECGLLTDSNIHWSCTEEWHDDKNGGLCTRDTEEVSLYNSDVRGRLISIVDGLDQLIQDAGELNSLFTGIELVNAANTWPR